MDTYFIRHTERLDVDVPTRDLLWKKRKIAIHYPDIRGKTRNTDNRSLSLDDYSGNGLRAMRPLVELAKNGGYVCAEYFQHPQCILGYVKPRSQLKLLYGKWGDLNGLSGRTAILKSLSLKRVRLVSPSHFAVISAARPRQGTIVRWKRAGKVIETIVEGKQHRPAFDLLSPDQQEVMCSEFLRMPDAKKLGLSRLVHLVLPVGRTLKDFDIYGITFNGQRIFGQVTYRQFDECSEKLQNLHKYRGSGNLLVLFCDCLRLQVKDNVVIVPIRYVYKRFTGTPFGKRWLRAASRVTSTGERAM